jgi:hypothetical protein
LKRSSSSIDPLQSIRPCGAGLLYDPTGISDQILRYPIKEDTNIASFLASKQSALDSALEKLTELRDEYN